MCWQGRLRFFTIQPTNKHNVAPVILIKTNSFFPADAMDAVCLDTDNRENCIFLRGTIVKVERFYTNVSGEKVATIKMSVSFI